MADLGRAGEKSDFLSILSTVRCFGQRGKYSSLRGRGTQNLTPCILYDQPLAA